MSTNEAWHSARIMHCLPNTREARDAFYAGVRHTINVVIDAAVGDEDAALLTLNDELHAFGYETIGVVA
jgi:hypothetical protein